jgi:hypothetical protein
VPAPVVEAIEATIRENRIDVLMIDPFVSSHRVAPRARPTLPP